MDFDPVLAITEWLRGLLLGWNLTVEWTEVILKFIGAFVVALLVLLIFIALIWIERKAAARFQDRLGPNRVGPFGLIQPFADAIKMITKEDTTPAKADKLIFNMAPILSVFSVIMVWAVVPFTKNWIGADLNVGVLYIAAVGSFGILSVLMAGWSSNNKYSLLGAFRGVAQLISYEVPLFLSLLIPVLLAGSMGINEIVQKQQGITNIFFFHAPLAALIYLVSSLAEVGRAPFDLLEAESELVAGYHVEYSGMKFGFFMAGEFLHSFTAGALMALLFFGGWNGPGAETYPILAVIYFFIKTAACYFLIIWSRLTFPRVRIDQIMGLNWKFMVPVSLVLLMLSPLVEYFVKDLDIIWNGRQIGDLVRMLSHLGLNLVILVTAFGLAGRAARKGIPARVRFEERPVARPPKEEIAA